MADSDRAAGNGAQISRIQFGSLPWREPLVTLSRNGESAAPADSLQTAWKELSVGSDASSQARSSVQPQRQPSDAHAPPAEQPGQTNETLNERDVDPPPNQSGEAREPQPDTAPAQQVGSDTGSQPAAATAEGAEPLTAGAPTAQALGSEPVAGEQAEVLAPPGAGPAPLPLPATPVPAEAAETTAAVDAAHQPEALHHDLFAPRTAPIANAPAEMPWAKFELMPGMPPVHVGMVPGVTMALAELVAAQQAGLALMHPPRRVLKELYPSWADPRSWTSTEELLAKTGHAFKVGPEQSRRALALPPPEADVADSGQ